MGRRKQVPSVLVILLVVALGACRQEASQPRLPADENAPVQTDRLG